MPWRTRRRAGATARILPGRVGWRAWIDACVDAQRDTYRWRIPNTADDDERRGDAARARAGANARAFGRERARVARARDVRRMEVDPAMRPNVAPAGAAEDGDEDDEGGEGGTEDARGRARGEDDANDANR